MTVVNNEFVSPLFCTISIFLWALFCTPEGLFFQFIVHFISAVKVFLSSSVTSVHHKLFHWQQVCSYHSCDTLKNILLQVEKPTQSYVCDYWFHHLCYLGIFLKAVLWSVLENVTSQLSYDFNKVFPSTWGSVWDFWLIFLVCCFGVLGFFVGLVLWRAFHLIWFEPTSQQYLTLAKVAHRHTYEENILKSEIKG